jgi:hypothetical protein
MKIEPLDKNYFFLSTTLYLESNKNIITLRLIAFAVPEKVLDLMLLETEPRTQK